MDVSTSFWSDVWYSHIFSPYPLTYPLHPCITTNIEVLNLLGRGLGHVFNHGIFFGSRGLKDNTIWGWINTYCTVLDIPYIFGMNIHLIFWDILGYFCSIYFGIFFRGWISIWYFPITTSAPPHGQDFACAPGRQRVKAWQSFNDTLMQIMHVCILPYTSAHIMNRWHIHITYIILYHMCVYARVAGTFLPSIRRSQLVLALGATITLQALPWWVLLTFVPPCATNMILIIHLKPLVLASSWYF